MKYLILCGLVYLGYRVFFPPPKESLDESTSEKTEYTDYEEVD